MNRPFRSKLLWTALGVILLVCIVWFFVLDIVVERLIEKYGSEAVGAKVELSKADVSLFPAGIELTGLAVTNPHEPMTNALDVRRIYGNMEIPPLFKKKVVIPELSMEGVRLGTKRSSSGALPGRPAPVKAEPGGACSESRMPSLSMPDVQEILERENLESLKMVSSVQSEIDAARKGWRQRLAELPDQKDFMAYKKRLEAFSDQKDRSLGSLLKSGSDALAVTEDLQADLQRLRQARDDFRSRLTELRQLTDRAMQAPLRDVARLKEKYGLSAEGLSNLSSLLFGDSLCTWTERAIDWYKRLKPILEGRGASGRAEGPQPEPAPATKDARPDLLIRQARISLNLSSGDFSGRVENITTDQRALGSPLNFDFSGNSLARIQSVSLEGSLDHTEPQIYKDALSLALKGLQLEDLLLSKSESWPLKLQKGLLNLDLKSQVLTGSLMADATARFASADFKLPLQDEAGALAESVASVLQDISGMNLQAQLTGSLEKYALRITSDLDQALKRAAANAVRQQSAALEKELRQAVTAKTQEPLNGLQTDLQDYSALGENLNERVKLGRDLLSQTGISF